MDDGLVEQLEQRIRRAIWDEIKANCFTSGDAIAFFVLERLEGPMEAFFHVRNMIMDMVLMN